MADWLANHANPLREDFISRYLADGNNGNDFSLDGNNTSLGDSMQWGVGEGPELAFMPSPVKRPTPHMSSLDVFCHKNNIDDCVAFLNQVTNHS